MLAINETRLRTLVRSALYTALTSTFAILLTWFWFGDISKSITLNLIIIVVAFATKLAYERYWLRVKWQLK